MMCRCRCLPPIRISPDWSARSIRSGRGARCPAVLIFVVAIVSVLACRSVEAGPRAWHDPATGLAIGGYDPVAYFTQGKPVSGHDDIELKWGGGVWRFVNQGNRAAFRKHPEFYAPRFAGYDAYALSNGRTTRGHPHLWVRYKDGIFLFYSSVNRRLWKKNREQATAAAQQAWEILSKDLPSTFAE